MDEHKLLGVITSSLHRLRLEASSVHGPPPIPPVMGSGPHDSHFWIKPFGIPEGAVDLREDFSADELWVDFSREPRVISPGDVMIVYRIGASEICFVARAGNYRRSSADEITQTPWRERWPWHMALKNLTPDFGKVWASKNLRPFTLEKEYNACHPQDLQKLGALKFGSDKLEISDGFAKFIIEKIIALK